MRTLQVIILCIWISTVVAVYDDKYMDVINPDIYKLKDNSYFGFSIGYLNEELYISAPAADDGSQIYKYNITSMTLTKLDLELKPIMHIPNKFKIPNWFGASIKSGSSFLVICAPRAPYMYGQNTVTSGRCIKIFQDNSFNINLPMITKSNLMEFNGGIDSFGWSIEVDKFDQILVGGPATIKDKNSGLQLYYNHLLEPKLSTIENILNLGYSIVSGIFFSNMYNVYAVSTTYGDHGEGEILFFDENLAVIDKLIGDEVGSMYGAALASSSLTDARASLLVGAPTWAGSGYNTGAVYVYVPVNETKFVLKRILKGTASGGHFGSSIANIGDLDADIIDDFAIGAPYEGKGVVYIYTGYGILSGKTWWRKIQPETFNSFGFSLVPIPSNHDVGCNDLGIGAPLSNRAFVLKCLPVTTIQLYTVHPNLKLRSNFSYYAFDVCLNITNPSNYVFQNKIVINVDLSHTAATLEKNKGEIRIPLKKKLPKFCETYTILTPIGNYDDHLKLDILATLKPSSDRTLPTILSDRSVTSLKEKLWIANCSLQYGRCKPKLEVSMTSDLTVPYKVGLRNTEKFNLTIVNSREIAYNACAVVSVAPASVRYVPPECSRNVTGKQFICNPSRWILPGGVWDINDIEIEMNSVTNKDHNINIHYDVYNHCGDDEEKQSKDYLIQLLFSFTDIDVIGASSSGKILNVTDQDVTKGKYFQHTYTISNDGPVDLVDVTCEITINKKSYLEYSTSKMTQQKDNLDTLLETCAINEEKETEDFVRIVCNISILPRRSETSIVMPLQILPYNFGAIRTENGTVFTSIDLQIPSNDNTIYHKTVSTTTTLLLETTALPTWLWVFSILLAIFFLVIIILILRERNCFHRENKKNLKELKKSIRMRSTYSNLSRSRHSQVPELEGGR